MKEMSPDEFRSFVAETTKGMTNGAAIGYAIMAARDLDLPDSTIAMIQNNMKHLMEIVTEEKAEQAYRDFKG